MITRERIRAFSGVRLTLTNFAALTAIALTITACGAKSTAGITQPNEPSAPEIAQPEVPPMDGSSVSDIDKSIEYYESRYDLKDPFQKLTDNKGEGYENLYGTRNFRAVLNGFVYRGGANNRYHRENRRDNMNPLPDDGLENLCKEGFDRAVYLYETRFSTAPKSTSCQSRSGGKNALNYVQKSPLEDESNALNILKIVFDKLKSSDPRPLYLHCWNGWHASGYVSALVLRQFCGYSAQAAVAYWDKNTDGNNTDSGYESIRNRIRKFSPRPELMISSSLQAKICPGL